MAILDLLYLLLAAGSLAFGLEAMLLGLSGQLSVLYRRSRGKVLGQALALGLGVVGASVLTTSALSGRLGSLAPFFLCLSAGGYTALAGKILGALRPSLLRFSPPPPPPPEVQEVPRLKKRG